MWSSRTARMMREQGTVARTNWRRRIMQGMSVLNLAAMGYFMYFLAEKRMETLGGRKDDLAHTLVYLSVSIFALLFLYITYLTSWGVPEKYEFRGLLFQVMILMALGSMALTYAF